MSIFITGTGTDIGKTYVTALLVKKLHEAGCKVAYYKAAMSGNDRDSDGALIPGDASFVRSISGISQPPESMCPYVYEKAYSPHLASRIEGDPVEMRTVVENYKKLCRDYDTIICEGSGGIICPIRYDEKIIMLEDIIKALELHCLIVADAGLGTINNTVLTAEYMRSHGMEVKGIILNNYHKGDAMEEDNRLMCEKLTGLPVIACVGKNDTDISIDTDTLINICSQGGKA